MNHHSAYRKCPPKDVDASGIIENIVVLSENGRCIPLLGLSNKLQ
jgi:hypothetical protein